MFLISALFANRLGTILLACVGSRAKGLEVLQGPGSQVFVYRRYRRVFFFCVCVCVLLVFCHHLVCVDCLIVSLYSVLPLTLSVCLSLSVSFYLCFVFYFLCPLSLPVCLCLRVSFCLCLSVCLSLCFYLSRSLSLSVCLCFLPDRKKRRFLRFTLIHNTFHPYLASFAL